MSIPLLVLNFSEIKIKIEMDLLHMYNISNLFKNIYVETKSSLNVYFKKNLAPKPNPYEK